MAWLSSTGSSWISSQRDFLIRSLNSAADGAEVEASGHVAPSEAMDRIKETKPQSLVGPAELSIGPCAQLESSVEHVRMPTRFTQGTTGLYCTNWSSWSCYCGHIYCTCLPVCCYRRGPAYMAASFWGSGGCTSPMTRPGAHRS